MTFTWVPNRHGEILKRLRVAEEWSRAELAQKLNVSQMTIGNWERGLVSPQGDNLTALVSEFKEDRLNPPENAPQPTETVALGAWVRQQRESKKWSRLELAERADVSYPTVINIETGRSVNPQQRTREKLEEALESLIPEELDAEIAHEAEIKVDGVGEFTDFDPYDLNDLPNVPGVYVLYDISDRPVYVGKGAVIASRVKSHEQKFWFKAPIVYAAAFVRIDNPQLRHQIEGVMIRFLKSNAVINKQLVDRGESEDNE